MVVWVTVVVTGAEVVGLEVVELEAAGVPPSVVAISATTMPIVRTTAIAMMVFALVLTLPA